VTTFEEAHSDDITQVAFHPQQSQMLLSASEDGQCCLFNLNQLMDQDEAVEHAFQTNSSVSRVGFFGPGAVDYLWVLNRIETFWLYNHVDANVAAAFGDVRLLSEQGFTLDYTVGCQYDTTGERLYLIAGAFEYGYMVGIMCVVDPSTSCTSIRMSCSYVQR
jgi:WD40 repeat protein